MPENQGRERLQTTAIVLGYAMSRLDTGYLAGRNLDSWNQAFDEAAELLSVPSASIKNLRDEFDPVHGNPRRGWHKRPLRASRQRVIDELHDVSDDALAELVGQIILSDDDSVDEAIDSLAVSTHVAHNVAERLLTGRRAEEFFLEGSPEIIGVASEKILDFRQAARGFDFSVEGNLGWAIEVKGIKRMRGAIQFTDREWSEAKIRQSDYWLVVVGNLDADPIPKVFRDPHATLTAHCGYQRSITATWRSSVSVQP